MMVPTEHRFNSAVPTMKRCAGSAIGASAKKTKIKIAPATATRLRSHLSLVAGMAELRQGFIEVIGR
jgi:hypothetical protein